MKLILVLVNVKTSKIVAIGAQKTRSLTLKSRRTQNDSLFGADFGPEAYLEHFSAIMSRERTLQSMAIVMGFTKIEEEAISNIRSQQDTIDNVLKNCSL